MNMTQAPSGANRGESSSGPGVRTVSLPLSSCLSQMRKPPSRPEMKATVWPSGEMLGPKSLPEKVNARMVGKEIVGSGLSHETNTPPRITPETTSTAWMSHLDFFVVVAPGGTEAEVLVSDR